MMGLTLNTFAQWVNLYEQKGLSIRSLSVPSKQEIWAGTSKGFVLHSSDGGENWQKFYPSKGSIMDFRGIAVLNKNKIVAVSAGLADEGLASIYLTKDGGKNWAQVFSTTESGVFLDGIQSDEKGNLLVYGDPIGNKPYILQSNDFGENWYKMNTESMPDTQVGEASFAASNSNMSIMAPYIILATQNRLFKSNDFGKTWTVENTAFTKGETSGIFGIYFINPENGVLVGGDYKDDKSKYTNLIMYKNGNQKAFEVKPYGLKESAYIYHKYVLMNGTSGSSVLNRKTGDSKELSPESYHCLECVGKICYAVGSDGRIAKIKLTKSILK